MLGLLTTSASRQGLAVRPHDERGERGDDLHPHPAGAQLALPRLRLGRPPAGGRPAGQGRFTTQTGVGRRTLLEAHEDATLNEQS